VDGNIAVVDEEVEEEEEVAQRMNEVDRCRYAICCGAGRL
jgi:hypothetical protein